MVREAIIEETSELIRGMVGNIVNHNGTNGLSVVRLSNRTVLLLTSCSIEINQSINRWTSNPSDRTCIPKLNLHDLGANLKALGGKLDIDGRRGLREATKLLIKFNIFIQKMKEIPIVHPATHEVGLADARVTDDDNLVESVVFLVGINGGLQRKLQ